MNKRILHGGGHSEGKTAEAIRSKFTEYLATNSATINSIIKMIALEFGVSQSTVIDAITKAAASNKGTRK